MKYNLFLFIALLNLETSSQIFYLQTFQNICDGTQEKDIVILQFSW